LLEYRVHLNVMSISKLAWLESCSSRKGFYVTCKQLGLVLGTTLVLGVAAAQTCDIAAPSSNTTINMVGWAFPITEFYAEELEVCNDVDNLSVNTQLLDSGSAREQVRLALSGGGSSPFAVVHGANGDVVEWASEGWVQPITDLVEKYREEYNLDDIAQTAWEGASYQGEIYGVPIVANTQHLMYRMDLFEEYGLAVPTTYDEVIEACSVLAEEPSIDFPFTLNLHAGWAWEQEFFHFLEAFGGTYLNEDNTPAFNSEAGVQALNKIVEVAEACMGREGLTYSLDDSEVGLSIGSLAFVQLWASRAPSMDDPDRSAFVGGIGFAPAPAPAAGTPLGGSAWNDFYMIPTTTDVERELAFLVIMEAADIESQTRAADFGIVTRQSVAESGVGGRYLEAASQTIANGVGIYEANPAVPLVRTALSSILPLVGNGDLTPEEALAQAEAAYTAEATAQGFIE
jgi:ABC-type glycerol-3-phosphate transport system substrate-binding protein